MKPNDVSARQLRPSSSQRAARFHEARLAAGRIGAARAPNAKPRRALRPQGRLRLPARARDPQPDKLMQLFNHIRAEGDRIVKRRAKDPGPTQPGTRATSSRTVMGKAENSVATLRRTTNVANLFITGALCPRPPCTRPSPHALTCAPRITCENWGDRVALAVRRMLPPGHRVYPRHSRQLTLPKAS